MPTTTIGDAGPLMAADVLHKRFSTLPASATVGEVREWFGDGSRRRMAFLADHGRYLGSLTPADLDQDLDGGRPASQFARRGPTIAPEAPATTAHELALLTDARRVPVVDGDGRMLGVVSVTEDLAGFCGTS